MDGFVRKPYRFAEIYECLAQQLGIHYRYESAQQAQQAIVTLTPEMLDALPASLREELGHALESLEGERIANAITKIADHDENIGRVLAPLVENFDYPSIIQALNSPGRTS